MGAEVYLDKPFDPEELQIRVKGLIEQRRKLQARYAAAGFAFKPDEVKVEGADERFLKRVIEVIEEYMSNEAFGVEDLGREVGLSRSQLHRKLKALTGQPASIFLRTMRLERAKSLLEQKTGTAAEISYLVGFNSPAYFSKCFKDHFGVTPGSV